MFAEEDLLPLSGLQHLVFCARQAALIHVERLWRDNRLTLEGTHLHARVDKDAPRREVRGDHVVLRGLALRSLRLGLFGRADVIELYRGESEAGGHKTMDGLEAAVTIEGLDGHWIPYPVDYKRGRPKRNTCDHVQICAQALCLEEMLRVRVSAGAVYYGKKRRRQIVQFDEALRVQTTEAAKRFREMVEGGETPSPQMKKGCERCSLLTDCMPGAISKERSARDYVASSLRIGDK